VVPKRSRRSCATIVSCQAASRSDRDAASVVVIPELNIAYGFLFTQTSLSRPCAGNVINGAAVLTGGFP
jgi:hypothetical protein